MIIHYLSCCDLTGASGGNKSSNTGVIVGAVVGGCVLVALLILAGLYVTRQKERVERTAHESSPFGITCYDPCTKMVELPLNV